MKHIRVISYFIVFIIAAASFGNDNSISLLDLVKSDDEKKIVSALEAGASVHVRNRFGETPLMLASERGNAKIVAALIKAGAGVNEKRKNGVTALIMAAERGNVDAAKELLKSSAVIDQAAADGNTALLRASMRGHYDMVKLLVDMGANISLKNKSGYTASDLAGKWRRGKIVQFLREIELKKTISAVKKKEPGSKNSVRDEDAEEE